MISETPKDKTDPIPLDVLFIDDSTNLCRAMGLWLNSSGYHTMTAFTAAQAEKIAIENHPKVIITDISLPDASGFDLQLRLKHVTGLEETRFIALSGRRNKDDPRHAIQSGFHTFISKPADFEQLAAVLRECLPDHSPNNANPT